jgi:hypothetical protein
MMTVEVNINPAVTDQRPQQKRCQVRRVFAVSKRGGFGSPRADNDSSKTGTDFQRADFDTASFGNKEAPSASMRGAS